ncbi:MAG: sigma-70 family RNA polymerase sigma factor [Spirosomataceae bacterium]
MDILDDQIQIDRILNGETSAYRFLVERYKRMVYSIALKVLVNLQDAEDAAQESFLKAFQQLHTFEQKSKFSTWLYTLTYRTCLNKLRERQSETAFLSDEVAMYQADDTPNAAELLSRHEQAQVVKQAIDQLPRQDGLLILLYYYEDKSIKEIEEITNLSASNIKIRLHRARKVLEQQLKSIA